MMPYGNISNVHSFPSLLARSLYPASNSKSDQTCIRCCWRHLAFVVGSLVVWHLRHKGKLGTALCAVRTNGFPNTFPEMRSRGLSFKALEVWAPGYVGVDATSPRSVHKRPQALRTSWSAASPAIIPRRVLAGVVVGPGNRRGQPPIFHGKLAREAQSGCHSCPAFPDRYFGC